MSLSKQNKKKERKSQLGEPAKWVILEVKLETASRVNRPLQARCATALGSIWLSLQKCVSNVKVGNGGGGGGGGG